MEIRSRTSWKDQLKENLFPKLEQDLTADVVIIGGGLAGIISGYFLVLEGKRVVLLEERKALGSFATGHTTAFLTGVIDTNLVTLAEMFGEERAAKVWQSGLASIDEFERIIEKEKIDCEFMRCPYFDYANNPKQFSSLEKEHEIASKLGFQTSLSRTNDLSFPNFGYLKMEEQAKFDPLKFLNQLANKAKNLGLKIFADSEVIGIDRGRLITAKTQNGSVKAEKLIVATYQPFDNRGTWFKKGMYRSYVFEINLAPGQIAEGLYVDGDNPYHYFRIDRLGEYDRMIIGGEDHRKEFKTDRMKQKSFRLLSDYAKNILRGKTHEFVRKWDGPILEPIDGVALIGSVEPNEFVATGFSGNGMTYSMISGLIFCDLVLNRENPWVELYNPKRIPGFSQLAKKGRDYLGEFFGGPLFRSPKPAY
ncbi:MAG: FAD-binding oxidoreductase [Candidatus Doudnabacteria bacterium]|nr:FAD-binding oxidoreductase [Candidatus Doudnabacteria bacterium]